MKSKLIILTVLISKAMGGCVPSSLTPQSSPNVLFIAVDDMADWLGCMGHPDAITPNMDKLASQGILFTQAYCTSPICGPSRAAILTGQRPETTKVYHNRGTYIDYVPEATAFPEYFRNHGYFVAGAGKINHSSTKVVDKNWDTYGPGTGIVGTPFTHEELATENMDPTVVVRRDTWSVRLPMNKISNIDRPNNTWSTFDWGPLPIHDTVMPDGRIANWAFNQIRNEQEKPMLLCVGFYKPHQPLFAPQKYFDFYDQNSIQLPPHIENDLDDLSQTAIDYAHLPWTSGCHETVIRYNQWQAGVHAYLATISFVDAQIGKLISALATSSKADNTWIILFSDHGWHLGEKEHWGKHTAWERSTRVPLIIVPPKQHRKKYDRGQKCNIPVNLLDLYPTLLDMGSLPDKNDLEGNSLLPLLMGNTWSGPPVSVTTLGRGSHAITDGKYKYIHYYDGNQELYDLSKDRWEWYNLAKDPSHSGHINGLKKYIVVDPDIIRIIRKDKFKVVFLKTGEIQLFDIYGPFGISEQSNVADQHPDLIKALRIEYANAE